MVHHNEGTVPQYKQLGAWNNHGLGLGGYPSGYPPQPRMTHYSDGRVCTFAYAVAQAAARFLLYDVSSELVNAPLDLILQQFCEGQDGHGKLRCLTVQPQLFNNHRGKGKGKYDIDIQFHDDGAREVARTELVRLSAKLNLEWMVNGQPADLDQCPDG